jgi:hypothetical protein
MEGKQAEGSAGDGRLKEHHPEAGLLRWTHHADSRHNRIVDSIELACQSCGTAVLLQGREVRLLPVERSDAQAFQIRAADGATREIIFSCLRCGSIRARILRSHESEWTRQRVTSVKVFDDPTPNGQINMRLIAAPVMALDATRLTQQQKEHLLRLLILCGKKLAAVYKHLQAYSRIEDELLARVQTDPGTGDGHIYLEQAQDLMIEFNEFLVQVKSSLDYLVKIPLPILGPRVWSVQTFGEKGEKVARALKQNLPSSDRSHARFLADHVIKKNQPWLVAVIEARDQFNHLIGAPLVAERFMVFAAKSKESGLLEVRRPMWSPDQSARAFMDVVWVNLVRFFETFTFGCINMRLRPGLAFFHGPDPGPGSNVSPWRLTTTEEMERVTKGPGWTKFGS